MLYTMSQTFGQLLRQIMKRERIRQWALGQIIERDQTSVSRLLNSHDPENVGIEQLAKICQRFPADAARLLTTLAPDTRENVARLLSGSAPPDPLAGWAAISPGDHRLIRLVRRIKRLPAKQRETILRMIETYCEQMGAPEPPDELAP